MSGRFAQLCAVSVLAITAAGAARAQEGVALEEVVVTAQKRPERALEAPLAITALTGARLDELGVRELSDLGPMVPGLLVQNQSPNNPGYAIRGVTSDNSNVFETPRVSLFQDGVNISKAQASYVELFDMDRVEVVRGPQSTLFGREALIGGVNLIQRKAALRTFDGYLHGEAGELGYRMGEGAVNLPVSDDLALRFAGRIRQRDGYVKNALGGEAFQSADSWAVRGGLKYAPGERFNADLIVNYQEDHPAGTAFKSHNFSPTDPVSGQVLAGLAPWQPAALAVPAAFNVGPQGVDRTVGGVTGLFDYKLTDALTVHAISAWRRYTSREVFDADGTSLPLLSIMHEERGDQWSQELRFNYDDGGRVRGFAGGSLFHSADHEFVPLDFDERVSLAQLTGQLNASALGLGLPATTPAPMAAFGNTAFNAALLRGLVAAQSGGRLVPSAAQAAGMAANLVANHFEANRLTNALTAADLFADITFKATDKLELTGGLRYSHERATTGFGATVYDRSVLGGAVAAGQVASAGTPAALAQANAILNALASPAAKTLPPSALPLFGLTDQPTANNGDLAKGTTRDTGFAWRAVARYSITADQSLYASYARGRRPPVQSAGGPSVPFGAPSLGVVPAEKVDSYEAGAKGVFLDRRLMADVAVFTYRYSHFQTVEQQGVRFLATDAGRARSYGLEAQGAFKPTDDLTLYATYAHNHARLKSGAYAGNHFRLSPDDSGSFSAVWRLPLAGGNLKVQPSYTWQSMVFFSDNNDKPALQQPPNALVADNVQDELQKGYGLANLRVSWTPEGGRATVEVFASNLFDKKYIIDAGNTGDAFGLPSFIAGPPRIVGVGLYWRFQ